MIKGETEAVVDRETDAGVERWVEGVIKGETEAVVGGEVGDRETDEVVEGYIEGFKGEGEVVVDRETDAGVERWVEGVMKGETEAVVYREGVMHRGWGGQIDKESRNSDGR